MSAAPWAFDVSSLMVLVGEAEESKFRSSRLTFIESLVAAPVAGIQSYLRSYDAVASLSNQRYFSPYGCQNAPLRNMQLDVVIKYKRLLDEGRYATYEVKDDSNDVRRTHQSRYRFIVVLWLVFTWLFFGGLIALWRLAPFGALPPGTWIGIANLVVLTGWSIIVRTLELVIIREVERKQRQRRGPQDADPDGIIFLGKRNSGLVFRGTRKAISHWTSSRLEYDEGDTFQISNRSWQKFITNGTLLVLLLVFVTVPNGSTTDQLVFVLLNILGQFNVFLGLYLNASSCLLEMEQETPNEITLPVESRTHVYGYLIRYFKDKAGVDVDWVEKAHMLPKTKIWDEWKIRVKNDMKTDPRALYRVILQEEERKLRPSLPIGQAT